MNGLTHLSLFSGIGGLDLAAEWAGIKTVGQCEWAEYPAKVLEKHWPDVPRWKDIRTLTGEGFYERTGARTVGIISGGFPCQPFSVAGKRRGREDGRYLWPEMARIIKELRPTWVVGENVAGIVKMALADILSELEACGYRARAFLIPACGVGARHRRYRVAIVGHAEHYGLSPTKVAGSAAEAGQRQQERKKAPCKPEGAGGSGNRCPLGGNLYDVQYADSTGRKEQHDAKEPAGQGFPCGGYNAGNVCGPPGGGLADRAGQPCGYGAGERRPAQSGMGGVADGIPGWMDGYWDIEPDIPRTAKGIPHRRERLEALGNAVVPQQFYPIFEAIAEIEKGQ